MIRRLAWDSKCFGYEVGRIDAEQSFDFMNLNEECQDYQLIYIFSKRNVEKLPLGVRKVDTKVILEKKFPTLSNSRQMVTHSAERICEGAKLCRLDAIGVSLISTQNPDFENELFQLALISGEYSRFRIDVRLAEKEFDKLYSSWIEKSFNGSEDGYVFSIENKIVGMITLTFNEDSVFRIGLLAVLAQHRGRGIGKLLIGQGGRLAQEKGHNSIQVTTQKPNQKAMRFYEKLGFKVIDEQSIYHWWRG